MQTAATARGLRLRPHTKTHKSPLIARWQIEHGAVGICCAKLGEAEVFADAGFADIRLPYPINPSNADRVLALLDRTRLSFIIDHPGVAKQWSDVMTRAGRSVDILVKVDVGFHRCGIDPDTRDTLPIITGIASLKGLNFKGLLSHAGQTYHAHSEDELKTMALAEARCMGDIAERCKKAGVPVEEVSAGATPPARFSMQHKEFTEYRPGNYVYCDRTQVALGAATFDDCALTVLATVVSKPARNRIILDSGSKTLTNDGARGFAPAPGHGTLLRLSGGRTRAGGESSSGEGASRLSGAGFPTGVEALSGHPAIDNDLLIERLSEEHATVKVLSGSTDLEPGDRVRIIPNHACVVSNLVDQAWLVDGDAVEPLPISARGRIT